MDSNFIKTSIKKIQEARDQNRLALFVGSGVSSNSGVPSWKNIIKIFADELGFKFNDQSNHSIDDYLVIPQKYYNERGQKEYYDKIYQLFKNDTKPNIIHTSLFEFQPAHIITTNFDDLLEQTVLQQGLFYHIVKEDKDLPYSSTSKLVIKMHGDLKLKNIVLKEDDYLSYSQNFKLIETFIKALFATNIILFIGYSANDPDFKLIFQEVKDILKKDFQPAYLLDTSSDNKDRITFEYYKNKGINVLYYREIKDVIDKSIPDSDSIKTLKEIEGKHLYKFIKYIQDFAYEATGLLDFIYNKLLIFNEMNYIMPDDIIDCFHPKLKCYYGLYDDKGLYISDQETIRLINKIKEDKKYRKSKLKKLKYIRKILKKAGISGLKIPNKSGFYEYTFKWSLNIFYKDNLHNYLITFNFKELEKTISNYLTDRAIDRNEISFLRKAFFLYKLLKIDESYNLLKEISSTAFRNKKYLAYFISEFNRKQLASLFITDIYTNRDPNIREQIIKETDAIDLEEIFTKLPLNVRNSFKYIRNISNFNFIYRYQILNTREMNEIQRQRDTIKKGGYYECKAIINILNRIENIWLYINLNYLFVEHYLELKSIYYLYLESIMISYSIPDINTNRKDIPFTDIPITKIKEIDYDHLFLLITYLKNNEIKELFNKYNINHLNVSEKDKIKLLEAFNNLLNSIGENFLQRPNDKYLRYMDNFLIIFSKLSLTKSEISQVVKYFSNRIRAGVVFDLYESFIYFLMNQFIKSKENIEIICLVELLKTYINKIISEKHSAYDLLSVQLIFRTTYIINKIDNNYIFKDPIITKSIIIQISDKIKENITEAISLYERILIPLYKISTKQFKSQIRKTFFQIINLLDDSLYESMLDLYYNCVLSKIIKPNRELNVKFIHYIKRLIDEYKNKRHYPDPIEKNLLRLADLCRMKYIDVDLIKTNLESFKQYSEQFSFMIDKENFDSDKFKIDWLPYLTENEHKKLSKNKYFRKVLLEKIKTEFLDETEKSKIKNILFKYYIK